MDNIDLTQQISFIEFHRFPLSINKNDLIAIDFYRHLFLLIDYPGLFVMLILFFF